MAQNVLNNDGAPEPKQLCIYELNDDCLIAIADHLDIYDWFNLYETSVRFRKIILEGIIPRKFIDFKQICFRRTPYSCFGLDQDKVYYDAYNIFQRFGKVITRFGISGENISFKRPGNTEFDEFLQLLLDYCTVGAFREVHIEFTSQKKFQNDLIIKTASYFKDINTLKVKTISGFKTPALNQWLELIPKHNLQYLEFNGIQPFSVQFELKSCALPKLEHFKLKNVNLSGENQAKMISFLSKMPHIKAYHNDDETALLFSNHIECIGKLHVAHLPEVAKQLKESTPNLKCLVLHGQLRNYRDFDATFKILAQKSTLEKLAIEICSDIGPKPLENEFNAFIQSVRNAQFIEFVHIHCNHVIRDISHKYIEYLATKVFQYRTLILSSNRTINHTIVKAIIRNCLKMENMFISGIAKMSISFYDAMVGERKKVIFGWDSPKPLIIFIEDAIHWKKALIPDHYKPEIVSIAPLPKEEIEYF